MDFDVRAQNLQTKAGNDPMRAEASTHFQHCGGHKLWQELQGEVLPYPPWDPGVTPPENVCNYSFKIQQLGAFS